MFFSSTQLLGSLANLPHEFPTSFTPIESSMCGFEYDQVNDDYKVFKIAECYSKVSWHNYNRVHPENELLDTGSECS